MCGTKNWIGKLVRPRNMRLIAHCYYFVVLQGCGGVEGFDGVLIFICTKEKNRIV